MDFAFVFPQFEPTGGDRIAYHHIRALQNVNHNVDIYYQSFLDSYYDDIEFKSKDLIPYLYQYNFQTLNLKKNYDIVVGNGLGGIQHVIDSKCENSVWFCQNFDPLVFPKFKNNLEFKTNVDKTYQKQKTFITYSPSLWKMIETSYGKKDGLIISNGVEYEQLFNFHKIDKPITKRICFMSAYLQRLKGKKLAKEIFTLLKANRYTTVEIIANDDTLGNCVDEHYTKPSYDEKCEIIANCDVMIHPSIYETWGLVPMESMALGTPVVGCDSKGFTQYAKHEKNSLIVSREAKEFLCAIKRLEKDRDLYNYIQERGFETAKKHSWDRLYYNVSAAYETLPLIFSGRITSGVLVF